MESIDRLRTIHQKPAVMPSWGANKRWILAILNFDIAFYLLKAQHLLPLPAKVEQGGLNG